MPIYFRTTPVSEPFAFDSVGNKWRQEAVQRPGGYPLYHYMQTETGCGLIQIQEKEFILEEGQGILTAPFVKHSYHAGKGEWFTLFATFTGTIEGSLASMFQNRPYILIEKEKGRQIEKLITGVVSKYENPPLDGKALSLDCYQLLMNFVEGIYTDDLRKDPLYEKYVAPVIKEIETNYSKELTIEGLSRAVYITPQYLSRLFGRFLGCSAYEYLTACRINRARELLLTHSHMEIQEIAWRVGFSDASHFIAMFKKATGCTPLGFRKMN